MIWLVCSLRIDVCSAREGKQYWRQSKPISRKSESGSTSNHLPTSVSEFGDGYSAQEDATATQSQNGGNGNTLIFNVLDYGAKGDGTTDDTKAFGAAWRDACEQEGSTMTIPSGSTFLVQPISFSGSNCTSNIVFQLDGKIIAPTSFESWGSGLLQWIEFTNLQGIIVAGKGTIDGQGSAWWHNAPTDNPTDESEQVAPEKKELHLNGRKLNTKMPSTKPTALRFYGSQNVTVTGIVIQNSPQTHLKFDDCKAVKVFELSVSSPGISPNTDGIHLQNSQDVVIYNTALACGDDCVSIQTGCSNVNIHNVNCGPGHGISIGGLGKDETKACVSNITVRDTTMRNTLTGVRIKTWQGGMGTVQGVMFSNIQVSEVETPMVIDQFYCDKEECQNKTSAVAISGITFENIRGTYIMHPSYFACSDSSPCMDLSLNTIELNPAQVNDTNGPFCWQAYTEVKTNAAPPIDCLKMGKPLNNPIQFNHDSC
ncbi:polygalacturonase At1g48100 [Malania oleifera]|uniref:polygalacturonase At1g48100 n=1 Tax=Malania oleifera TaxID=397392 RepID=UPI0025AE849E|nr:polygalacturonase At1g48100 [Malania oleifera]